MPMNRREFLAVSAAGAAMLNQGVRAFAAPAANLQVSVDAARIGAPVSSLVFGAYMEPATTRVWSEMLSDRKFVRDIVASDGKPMNPMFRMFAGDPWRPVGPAGTVEMDKVRPWVGVHTPCVKLAGSEPRGISQASLRLGKGKSFVGRVILAGDPTAKVEVRLVWGPGPGDSQTIAIPPLSSEYKKFPLKFTAQASNGDGRLEIVGTGSGKFHVGAASLMPADNVQGFHAGLIKLIKESHFGMAKWPGGNFVSTYDWRHGLGDSDKRPPRLMPDFPLVESNDMGINEFMTFCRLIGAEPDLAINSGFGEARCAAEEVEYVNGSIDTPLGKLRAAHGHPEPYKVRYWCIGNEMYGYWQFGHMSFNQYSLKHNMIVDAMKQVDPTIKVTSAVASPCELGWCLAEQKQFAKDFWNPPLHDTLPLKFGSVSDGTGWLLANCAHNIDMISEHTYSYPELAFDVTKQEFVDASHEPLELRARRPVGRLGEAWEAWDKYVEKMPSLKEKKITFSFDEWGSRFHSLSGADDGMSFMGRGGMLVPLSYGLFLHEMFRHSDMVGLSCPTAGLFAMMVDDTNEAVGYSGEGVVMKLMATYFTNALPVAVDGDSPQRQGVGTPFVDMGTKPTGSPTYPLDLVAAFSADRKKFLISVVNPTEQGQSFTPKITGVKLREQGKLAQIAPAAVDASNVIGKEPAVKIVETAQNGLPETVAVPPFSISIYQFDVEKA